MTKTDFIRAVHAKVIGKDISAKLTPAMIGKVFDACGTVALASLKNGDDVPLFGLGLIKPVKREARKGRNPRTGKEVKIPARNTAKLSVSKMLKEALN